MQKEIKDMVPIFKKHPEVKLVYLFGSQATGDIGPLSDYDFAIYLDEKNEGKKFNLRLEIMNDLALQLRNDSIDVVVLNDVESPELKYNIIKSGVVVFEKEPFRVLLEPRILNEYFDFHLLLARYHLTKSKS